MEKSSQAEDGPKFIKGGALTGKRSKQNIMQPIMANLHKFRELYIEKIKEDSNFNAIVKVHFIIDGWGNVIEYKLMESDVSDSLFLQTIEENVRGIKFSELEDKNDKTDVYYPFVFHK